MKRFIDLRNQIHFGPVGSALEPHFAFYDTVVDQFETFDFECTWHSKRDFRISYENDGYGDQLERYLALMPDWVPEE